MTQPASVRLPDGTVRRYRRVVSTATSRTTGPRADVLAGVATAAVVLAVAVGGTWGASSARSLPGPSSLGWVLMVAAAVALVGVRARALATLGATGVLVTAFLATGGAYGPVLLPVGVAAYTAARRAAVDRALALAATVLVALWLPLWWQDPATPVTGATPEGWWGLLPVSAWVAVPFSAGYARRVHAQAAARARAFALHEQVAGERLRLSQDVHDVVGHGLAAIKMQADVALHVLGDRAVQDHRADPGTAALRAISGSAASALEELREVLGALGATREEAGGAPGLDHLDALRARMTSAGLDLRWTSAGDLGGLPERVDRAAYRVLQEGLTNVLRHGDTDAPVEVEVVRAADGLRLQVANRATSPAEPGGGPGGGAGLPGMRSRVEAVGGRVTATRDGEDFVLDARLPVTGDPQ